MEFIWNFQKIEDDLEKLKESGEIQSQINVVSSAGKLGQHNHSLWFG